MDICQLWHEPMDAQQVQESDVAGFACQPMSIQNADSCGKEFQDMFNSSQVSCNQQEVSQPPSLAPIREFQQITHDHVQPEYSNSSRFSTVVTSTSCESNHVDIGVSDAAEVPRRAGESGAERGRHQDPAYVSRNSVKGEDHVWESQSRPDVSRSVPRCQVDRLVHPHLREQCQTGSSEICQYVKNASTKRSSRNTPRDT